MVCLTNGLFNGDEPMDEMAEGADVPVTPTTTLTTNTTVTTTTMTSTSGAGLTTQSQTSTVTSTTVNTVTTSLATLNLATDEARLLTTFPESIPLQYSVTEMQSQDLITTDSTQTRQSTSQSLSERPVRTHFENINLLQATATQELSGSRTSSTTGGASAGPTDEATRLCPLCNPTEVSTQTPEGAYALPHDAHSQEPRMVPDDSSTVEAIISPSLLAQMVAMERQKHTSMSLNLALTQGEEFSWDNIQFISDLIFHTDIYQSNSNYIVERIGHLQRLTTWIMQLLECDADCVISLRRELENLLESSLAMVSHLADPAFHHDQETLLMRPIFPEPRRLDSVTLGYISFDPNVFNPPLPLDRRPQSPLSQNSTMGVPSLWDEEQFEYTRNGDPMSPRLCTRHREPDARRTRHRSDELAESDRQELTRVPRRRPSHLTDSLESRQSVESSAVQPRVSRLRVRHQAARNGARRNGDTDPSDDLVPLEEGEILVGRARSLSSPMRLLEPRAIHDQVSPPGPNQTVQTGVFPNGSDWDPLPRVPDSHMPFASMAQLDYENLGMRSDSSSNNGGVTDTSTVEMTGLDVNSPRGAALVEGGVQRAVGGQDSLPSLLLPEFSAVPLISEPFNNSASANFPNEVSSGSLGRQGAREDREVRGGAILRFERVQRSRTRSSPELIFHFSDAEDLGLERYSPNQPPYISSSSSESSSQASRSPVVSTTAGSNTYVDDSQASTLPVQDQVVDYSLPVDITGDVNNYVSEGNVTPEEDDH